MKIKNINLIITFICVFLIFLLNINSVSSQNQEDIQNQNCQSTSQDLEPTQNTIRMGVRLPSELFGKIRYESPKNPKLEGYCVDLGDKLAANIQKKIEYKAIANDHAGDKYKRFKGLQEGLIDLECGPNTRFVPLQPDEINDENKWKECIVFSDDFYETDIKLLLKKDDLKELESTLSKSEDDYFKKVNTIGIEVVYDTLTYSALKDYNNSTTSKRYTINTYSHKISDNPEEYKSFPAKTRYEALTNLEKYNDTAYASDLPILQTILEKGFINKGYAIFPRKKDDLLPGLEDDKYKQKYGIAFCSNANLNHIGINLDTLKAEVNKLINPGEDSLFIDLNKRSEEIEGRIDLLQDYYENKLWEDPNSHVNNGVEGDGNQPKYLIIVAIICLLLVILYSLYFIFNDSELRRKFLSQIIVVIITLFTGLVTLLLDLLQG